MTSISSKNTIRVDKENGILRSCDLVFYLSKNECLMLELLYENSDSVISIENIIKSSWPGKVVSPISVPVAIKHIRDILKKCIATQVIVTHKGVGYSFIKSEIKIIFSHVDNYTEKGNTLNTNFFRLLPMGHPRGLCILFFLFCTFILSIPEWNNTIISYDDPVTKSHTIQNYPQEEGDFEFKQNITNVTIFREKIGGGIICEQSNCIEEE